MVNISVLEDSLSSTMSNMYERAKSSSEGDEMKLFVWGPGWGLPSIHAESLQIMTYVKFSGAPVRIIECENPWQSPNGNMPFFQQDSRLLVLPTKICAYLKQKNYSCDFGLSPKQNAEVVAYTQFVSEAFEPALQYFCWVMDSNYRSVMRPCYSKRLPWFYKFWYTDRRLRYSALEFMQSLYKHPLLNSTESEVVQKAQDCIKLLSDKLGTQEYFLFPHSPSSLDAVIFSYLALFLKIPLPNFPLKEIIRVTPNLERFVARILHRYYGNIRDSLTTSSYFGIDGHATRKPSDEVQYPRNQKILSIGVGIAVMLAFAFKNGMVEFGMNGTRAEVNEQEDEDNF